MFNSDLVEIFGVWAFCKVFIGTPVEGSLYITSKRNPSESICLERKSYMFFIINFHRGILVFIISGRSNFTTKFSGASIPLEVNSPT